MAQEKMANSDSFMNKFHDKFMSLNIPTVETCCCSGNLPRAGLIIGIVGIIADILYIVVFGGYTYFTIIGIIINGCWIYGIKKDKPNFMFAKLIADVIGWMFVVLIYLLRELLFNLYERIEYRLWGEVATVAIIYSLLVILLPYQWIVSYSLYKMMRQRHNKSGESDVNVAVPIHGYAI